MFGEKEIIAFSPELGSSNKNTNTFFTPRDLIFETISENYKIVKMFLEKNTFEMTDLSYSISNNKDLVMSFKHSGLNVLNNSKFTITTDLTL